MSQSQVRPRDKRWLGRAACLSIVASRLEELGHAPDFVSDAALAELVNRAAGSEQSLRAGLAGALFLASTDDAPRVERIHVVRAFPEEAGELPPGAAKGRARWLLPFAAVALAASIIMFQQTPERTAPRAARTSAGPAHPASLQKPARAAPAPKLQPPMSAAASHAGPASAPQAAAPRPIEIALPVGPQARISVLAGPHSDPAPLIARLRQAGIAPLVEQDSTARSGNEVLYYFVEDGVLAERIAHEAKEAGTAQLAQPRLVQLSRVAPRPPGSVDILLQ